jgi:hypothetical protein
METGEPMREGKDRDRDEKRPEPDRRKRPKAGKRPGGWSRDAELKRSINAAVQDNDLDAEL